MANAMRYQIAGNKILSGLTRMVCELEEVKAGQGGTSFLSGSHKAHFAMASPTGSRPAPRARRGWTAYTAPWTPMAVRSVVIFTKSLLHAANDWTNPDNGRCAIFQCYNSLWA